MARGPIQRIKRLHTGIDRIGPRTSIRAPSDIWGCSHRPAWSPQRAWLAHPTATSHVSGQIPPSSAERGAPVRQIGAPAHPARPTTSASRARPAPRTTAWRATGRVPPDFASPRNSVAPEPIRHPPQPRLACPCDPSVARQWSDSGERGAPVRQIGVPAHLARPTTSASAPGRPHGPQRGALPAASPGFRQPPEQRRTPTDPPPAPTAPGSPVRPQRGASVVRFRRAWCAHAPNRRAPPRTPLDPPPAPAAPGRPHGPQTRRATAVAAPASATTPPLGDTDARPPGEPRPHPGRPGPPGTVGPPGTTRPGLASKRAVRQFMLGSSGYEATKAREPGWRRRTRFQRSSGSSPKTSSVAASSTHHASISTSPSSWPALHPA